MHKLIALPAAVLIAASPAPLRAQTAEERAQIEWVEQRGRLLFDLDRAAWVGTDDMMERLANARSQGLRGYIVERDGNGYAVTFFGGPEASPVAFYRGRVVNRRVVGRDIYPADARPALTAAQRRLAAVRAMAAGLGKQPCNEAPFNTAVIPPEAPDEPIDLYLLTPQINPNEYPLGGHYRFTIAADGSVASSREFTQSCIALPSAPDENGNRPAALMITHLLDAIPTEIHVFTSLSAGLPIYVATGEPQRLWEVAGDRIELVDRERRQSRRRN